MEAVCRSALMPLHVRGAQVSSLALTAERVLSTSHDRDKNNFSENTQIESNHPSHETKKKKKMRLAT